MGKKKEAKEVVESVEESLVFELLEATGKADSAKTNDWLRDLVNDADKGSLKLEKKTLQAIDERISEIDRALSDYTNRVMHHEKFQKLEGSWRGLSQLVTSSNLGSDLRVQVMDISKDELVDDITSSSFQRTELYDKIYTQRYNILGGIPLGSIVGDFEFSHASTDVKTLTGMAQICAVSHCPFLTSPSPKLFGFPEESGWSKLSNLDDVSIDNRFDNPSVVEMTDWRAFREMEDSRYVSMCLPRVMARLPYGQGDCEQGIKSFTFQEFPLGSDGLPTQTETDKYCWTNAAYSMATCMSHAYTDHGWAVNIRGLESGGKVEGLPIHYFTSKHSDTRVQCPTEVPIPMSKEKQLGNVGFLPLVFELNSAHAVFLGGQTVHKPKEYDDSPAGRGATANSNLSARLPYIMAVSRAAHALQPMLRAQIGQSKEADQIELFLHNWFVNNYVTDSKAEETKAAKPFSSADIKVEEDERNPGVYNVKVNLRPHFQVEEINVGMSLVASKGE